MKIKMIRKAMVALLFVPLLLLGTTSKVQALPAVVSLSITRCEQEESKWCWAACAQMVGNYYGNSYSQSIIVYQIKSSFTNAGATDSEVSQAMNYVLPSGKKATCVDKISHDTMMTKLAQGYPIPIKMLWNSGGAHDVVVSGYTSDGKITITDPGEGCSRKNSYSYTALVTGTTISSGTGKYVKTWLITS